MSNDDGINHLNTLPLRVAELSAATVKPLLNDPSDPTSQQPRYRPAHKRVAVRAIGMSAADEAKLVELQTLLSDPNSVDGKPSVSLVFQQALERLHVQILGIRRDPDQLAQEVSRVHAKAKRVGRKRRQSHHHHRSAASPHRNK